MADTAAHLVDHVLPDVPYRQWVLSFPPPLRYLLAYDGELVSRVIGYFVGAITSWQRHETKHRYGLPRVADANTGAITAIQRFGSALNLNLHLHVLVVDGVFVAPGADGPVRFLQLGAPNQAEVNAIGWRTCTKTIDHLRKEGRWFDAEQGGEAQDPFAQDEPLLSEIYGASIQGTLVLGPNRGRRLVRLVENPSAGRPRANSARAAYGFDVHAAVKVDGGQIKARERLCKYLLRPPAAADRFERSDDGRVCVRLKRSWDDGTTHIVFTPAELVERLVALIPPPRQNQLRYHGVFAARHHLRERIVSRPEPNSNRDSNERTDDCCRGSRMSWARLMRRVFSLDVLSCPRCDSAMQRVAFITDPAAIKKILGSVGYAADSPDQQTAAQTS